jgi:hypothetical protein
MCGRKIQKKKCIEHEDFVIINVETLQQELEPNDLELMAVMAQNLWLRRNVVVHWGLLNHATLLVSKASNSLATFHSANSRQQIRAENDHNTNLRWQGPSYGRVCEGQLRCSCG